MKIKIRPKNGYIVAVINMVFFVVSKEDMFVITALIFGWLPVLFVENKSSDEEVDE